MTSSLQHQEVRIPAIPFPSYHLLGWFVPLPGCSPPSCLHAADPHLSDGALPLVVPCIPQSVEGGSSFLFDFWEGTVRKSNLPSITLLGKGPGRVAQLSAAFSRARRVP